MDEKQKALKDYIAGYKDKENSKSYLIAVLHKAQSIYGYLSRETMEFISEEMQIPTANIWGVATFYHLFNLTPKGKYIISVCMGTACYVKGAAEIMDALKDELKIKEGEYVLPNSSKFLTENQFNAYLKYAERLAENAVKALKEGKFAVSPYENACLGCLGKGSCMFDDSGGECFRRVNEIRPEVIEKITNYK